MKGKRKKLPRRKRYPLGGSPPLTRGDGSSAVDPDTRLEALERSVNTLEIVVGIDDLRYPLPEGLEPGGAGVVLAALAQDIGVNPEDVRAFGAWLLATFHVDQRLSRGRAGDADKETPPR